MTQKSTLRKVMRSRLKEIPAQVIAESSAAICQHIAQHYPAPTIAIFSAHGPEVDLAHLHEQLPDSQLLYPLCHQGGVLTFHHVSDIDELTPGTLGILEPDPKKHSPVPISEINTFLCPGLAFGRDGSRLGHGGGFYDRALAQRSSTALVIGVALQIQVVDSVPTGKYDIPLDHLITENGLVF